MKSAILCDNEDKTEWIGGGGGGGGGLKLFFFWEGGDIWAGRSCKEK